MKPLELYNRVPEKVTSDLYGISDIQVPEVDLGEIEEGDNKRVKVHYYKDVCYDGRRTWTLASVSLDGEFFMITQNAGREGRDFTRRIVTNIEKYKEMVQYLKSLEPVYDGAVEDIHDENEDMDNLDNFYSDNLYSKEGY